MNKDTSNFKDGASKSESTKINALDFIWTGIGPLLVSKSIVLYFGVMYSAEPGEGYGYGLVFGFSMTVISFGRFLYKYRNYVD